jgi:hypothetical protein
MCKQDKRLLVTVLSGFIGQHINVPAMQESLDECLLKEEEPLKGQSLWFKLDDPFLLAIVFIQL